MIYKTLVDFPVFCCIPVSLKCVGSENSIVDQKCSTSSAVAHIGEYLKILCYRRQFLPTPEWPVLITLSRPLVVFPGTLPPSNCLGRWGLANHSLPLLTTVNLYRWYGAICQRRVLQFKVKCPLDETWSFQWCSPSVGGTLTAILKLSARG